MDLHRFTTPRANLSVEEKISYLQKSFSVSYSEASSILNSCENDLEQAASLLWNMHSQVEGTKSTGSVTSNDEASTKSSIDQATGTELNPIDLTNETESGDPELQQALALSIQQMNNNQQQSGLSIEEEELSRAVEASIAENNANMARLGIPLASVFVDPQNPHERKRQGNSAVGLKNIGNTCWFSAVIQSLHHIPVFCNKILGYQPPPLTNGITEYPPSVVFVQELQKLFAMLLLTPRKYIDPHFVIQVFKETFVKENCLAGTQQDVSEFTHKLLEWIEDAFRVSSDGNMPNPIVELFTGHCKREGVNNGEEFLNDEDFGALPIQVHNHTHLHDSLGSYTFNPEVNQETWFTHLPPVLVLSLSRFQYNQASGQAEKVHDRLKFDLQLSMDRYLEKNKQVSRKRRKEVMKLKSHLQELEKRLLAYTQYNNKPVSVMESLSLTLKFIHEHEWCSNEGALDSGEGAGKRPRISHRPSPRSVSHKEQTTLEGCLNRWIEELNQDVKDLNDCISAAQSSLDAVYIDDLMNSTPYYLHAVLVHQGQASGGHYWAYVRRSHACLRVQTILDREQTDNISTDIHSKTGISKQEAEIPSKQTNAPIANTGQYTAPVSCIESKHVVHEPLVESVSSMDNSPRSVTNEPTLTSDDHTGTHPALSITVDKGTVNQDMDTGDGQTMGNLDNQSDDDVWLKFNDVAVSEVTWEDVQKESYGEGRNTSAYCLMYINKDLHEKFTKNSTPLAVSDDLQRYVDRDASDFHTEIANYDERAIQAASHIPSSTEGPQTGGHPSPSSGGARIAVAGAALSDPAGSMAASHADRSPELMQVDSPPIPPVNPHLTEELKTIVFDTYSSMSTQYQGQLTDPRPVHIVTYAIQSGAAKELIKGLILEMIIQHYSDLPRKSNIKILAQKEFLALFSIPGMQADLDKLRIFYNRFCTLCWNMIQAVKSLRKEEWESVLAHTLQAYGVHIDICKAASTQFSLEKTHLTMLTTLRRNALQKVSDLAFGLFEKGDVEHALKEANGVLVPCLNWFASTTADNDEGMLEIIREKWCQCLVQPGLTEREQDQLGDLLTCMFEDTSKLTPLCEPSLPQNIEYYTIAVELSDVLSHLSRP